MTVGEKYKEVFGVGSYLDPMVECSSSEAPECFKTCNDVAQCLTFYKSEYKGPIQRAD